jgi:hypothetical protein
VSYDPENAVRELQHARDTREQSFRDMAAMMQRAAATAAEQQFTDPALREAAGHGAIAAAGTLAEFAHGGQITMVNAVGLFGLALVEHARSGT